MPYHSISDLPDSVRHHLPEHAQEIYLEVFNSAWKQYADWNDQEAVSHKVAWSVVKKKYEKQGEQWVEK